MALTPVQKQLLASLRAGTSTLVRNFDVYAGYWYEELPSGARPRDATVQALVDAGHIVQGEMKRVYSGRQQATLTLPSPPDQGER